MSGLFLTIEGAPIAKERPRFARKTGISKKTGKPFDFVQTYNNQTDAEGLWVLKALDQIRKAKVFFTSPVEMTAVFWIQRPAGHYGTGRNQGTVKPSAPKYPASVPDVDNYLKAAFDILNQCAVWTDDRLVVSVHGKKCYVSEGMRPCTHIYITDGFPD